LFLPSRSWFVTLELNVYLCVSLIVLLSVQYMHSFECVHYRCNSIYFVYIMLLLYLTVKYLHIFVLMYTTEQKENQDRLPLIFGLGIGIPTMICIIVLIVCYCCRCCCMYGKCCKTRARIKLCFCIVTLVKSKLCATRNVGQCPT